jgi:hypothetical protein
MDDPNGAGYDFDISENQVSFAALDPAHVPSPAS